MIYGWNFNSTPIPEPVKKRFSQVKQINGFGRARLQGATDTKEELEAMLIQADNGHRSITWIGPRRIKDGDWYGVYCS
jgi:hypothetical protein